MVGLTWKTAVLVAVLVIYAALEFQLTEAQSTVCSQCASNAYCYTSYSGRSYCYCRRGYHGDGYIGSGNSGCRRNRLRWWKVVVAVVVPTIGALLLCCLCAACLRNCLVRRRNRASAGYPPQTVEGYPQQSYPQQGVPMAAYETNNHKVPGPQGVV